MKLRYGDPPSERECKDAGVMNVPKTLEISLDPEGQQREVSILPLVGTPLPLWARVRYAVRTLEKKGGNQKVTLTGIGTLVVGAEGWEVL